MINYSPDFKLNKYHKFTVFL